MKSKQPHSRGGFKSKLASLLTASAGSVVLATAVMTTPAEASPQPSSQPVVQRADALRAQLATTASDPLPKERSLQLAWWRNWLNGGWAPHPYWHNWPNWRNWHNWGNWRNY